MPQVYNLAGLNLKISPFLQQEGEMIRSVNMMTDVIGAKKKRAGYVTYLGTPDTSQVNSLFNFTLNNGTQFWNYRYSGSILYYSQQGTGAWTTCGSGTMTAGANIGYTILENTLIIGDGGSVTRHTTNGTSFTTTASAPIANYFTSFQGRVYAGGTASSLFYSTTGTPTNWTSDSSSILIPNAGKINGVFNMIDSVHASKNSGLFFKYNGADLIDLSTAYAPSSPWSVGSIETSRIYLNRFGYHSYEGRPKIISSQIESQIFNDDATGIVGSVFDNAPAIAHRYDYLCSVGSVTDTLTGEQVNNCVHKYDARLNQWDNWSMGVRPTAWAQYKDASGNLQLIFGDVNGQCYTFGGTAVSDNGSAIEAIMEFVIHGGRPDLDKTWRYLKLMFNPGNEAKVAVAISDTFTKGKKKWIGLGDCSDGSFDFRFPSGSQGRLLFVKITEMSTNNRFQFYGFSYEADLIERR